MTFKFINTEIKLIGEAIGIKILLSCSSMLKKIWKYIYPENNVEAKYDVFEATGNLAVIS